MEQSQYILNLNDAAEVINFLQQVVVLGKGHAKVAVLKNGDDTRVIFYPCDPAGVPQKANLPPVYFLVK